MLRGAYEATHPALSSVLPATLAGTLALTPDVEDHRTFALVATSVTASAPRNTNLGPW